MVKTDASLSWLSVIDMREWRDVKACRVSDHPITLFTFSEKLRFYVQAIMFYNHPPLNSFFADTYGITGSEPPRMTENRKIRLGSVKGDTLVTKLQSPMLAFEWTECQLQSPSVARLNKNITSHSLHIKCTKSLWHLARIVWVMKRMWACRINTCINSFYVCNNIRVLYMSIAVWVCVWREATVNESSGINHVWILIRIFARPPIWSWPYSAHM